MVKTTIAGIAILHRNDGFPSTGQQRCHVGYELEINRFGAKNVTKLPPNSIRQLQCRTEIIDHFTDDERYLIPFCMKFIPSLNNHFVFQAANVKS